VSDSGKKSDILPVKFKESYFGITNFLEKTGKSSFIKTDHGKTQKVVKIWY